MHHQTCKVSSLSHISEENITYKSAGVCLLSVGLRCAVSLTSILEPVADLYERQTSFFRQRSLLVERRVEVAPVAVFERLARPLLEAVDGLLAVPDCPWQRVLASQPVLIDSAYS